MQASKSTNNKQTTNNQTSKTYKHASKHREKQNKTQNKTKSIKQKQNKDKQHTNKPENFWHYTACLLEHEISLHISSIHFEAFQINRLDKQQTPNDRAWLHFFGNLRVWVLILQQRSMFWSARTCYLLYRRRSIHVSQTGDIQQLCGIDSFQNLISHFWNGRNTTITSLSLTQSNVQMSHYV